MRRPLTLTIYGLGALGLFAGVSGVLAVFFSQYLIYSRDLICLMAAFTVLSPWSVRLRSGSAWRPGMAIITGSIFLIPPVLTPIVAIPGLFLVAGITRQPLKRYPITIGHVALSAYAGAWVYHLFYSQPLNLTTALPAAAAALVAYIVVNRLVAAVIVAERDQKALWRVIRLTFLELGWGHVSMYLLSITTALLYRQEGLPGLILSAALLVGVYQSVAYYSRVQALEKAASTDGLTGAENRMAWDAFTRSMEHHRTPGTLAMIDIDGFKRINDTHGHLAGDAMLRDLAATLLAVLRKPDHLFRYGGDEFVLFIAHDAKLEELASQRIRQLLAQVNILWEERGLTARASVGMCFVPAHGARLEDFLQNADQQMYADKLHWRNDSSAIDHA